MRIKRKLDYYDAGNGPSSFTTVFTPGYLFTSGAQGAWYDPSDFSTLYQDANGTTPVTAVEQPVRLMLDRSKGLVLGPELVSNGDFATDSDWTKGTGWTITGGQAVATAVAFGQALRQTIVAPTNVSYWIEFNIVVTSGGVNVWMGTSGTFFSVTSSGLSRVLLRASGANDITISAAFTGFTGTVDNVSIKALPGNHAVAPNDASRPILRARYNLLTYSEQFNNAAWQKNNGSSVTANAVVAPDGTTTADQIDLSASELSRVQQPLSGQPTASYTFTVWLRVASGSVSVRFGSSADLDVITVTDTWQRFTSTKTITTPAQPNLTIRNEAGGGAKTLYAWGAQILTAADQSATGGAYQRIAAATDYDTSNPVWRPYLAFDGSDDSFSTSSIDFSGTDEMTVFAGVTKLSDAARGMVCELSAGTFVNNGSFRLAAPEDATFEYSMTSRGTVDIGANINSATYAAPNNSVLTGTADIGAPSVALRINGFQVASSATSQGTGNYGNYPLFIGRRNNTSDPFNGRLYGLTVLGRTATAAELSAMETWINGKTGAY